MDDFFIPGEILRLTGLQCTDKFLNEIQESLMFSCADFCLNLWHAGACIPALFLLYLYVLYKSGHSKIKSPGFMKKIVLFTAGLIMAISAFSQQCLHEGIGLYTQEQVDRFQATYPNCKEILGDVVISGDDIMYLEGLNGFLSLASIGGLIQIDYNDVLRNITALGTLKTIQGAVYINSNSRLMKLFGLDSINAGGIRGLTITNNNSLSSCDVLSICRYLDIPYRYIRINNNASGCNSEAEVKAGCDTLSVENPAGIETVFFHPNPANGSIIFEIPGTSLNTRLVILNLNGEEVLTRVVSAPQDHVDISSLPPGVYCVKLLNEGSVAVSKLVKKSE